MTALRTRTDLRRLGAVRGSLFVGSLLACGSLSACGRQVDLGGGADAGTGEASVTDSLGGECEPCETTSDCARGAVCSHVAGHLYCTTICRTSGQCEPDETCAPLVTAAGATADVCAPEVGGCSAVTAPPPTSDGAPLDACGGLVAPRIVSDCHACEHDCQPNGCYGGYWCEPSTRRCRRPPSHCP